MMGRRRAELAGFAVIPILAAGAMLIVSSSLLSGADMTERFLWLPLVGAFLLSGLGLIFSEHVSANVLKGMISGLVLVFLLSGYAYHLLVTHQYMVAVALAVWLPVFHLGMTLSFDYRRAQAIGWSVISVSMLLYLVESSRPGGLEAGTGAALLLAELILAQSAVLIAAYLLGQTGWRRDPEDPNATLDQTS